MKLTDYASADSLTLALVAEGWRKISDDDDFIEGANCFRWAETECPTCSYLHSTMGLCPSKVLGHSDLCLLVDIREDGSIGKCWQAESFGGSVHSYEPGELGIKAQEVGQMLLDWHEAEVG